MQRVTIKGEITYKVILLLENDQDIDEAVDSLSHQTRFDYAANLVTGIRYTTKLDDKIITNIKDTKL